VIAPLGAIVPREELPPATPFTLHVTPGVGFPVAEIVAEKICSPPAGTFAMEGATMIAMLSVSVITADAVAELSAALTAVTVMLGAAGMVLGAVYTPDVEIIPTLESPCVTPSISHVTVVFVVPVTAT